MDTKQADAAEIEDRIKESITQVTELLSSCMIRPTVVFRISRQTKLKLGYVSLSLIDLQKYNA